MPVQIFDRVFQGDDMGFPLLVDDIDEAGERRGFAAAGRPRDKYKTVFLPREVPHGLRDPELLRRGDLRRD